MTHRIKRLPGTPQSIAAGVACGVAASFTPFIGLHFVLAALFAWLVGGVGYISGLPSFSRYGYEEKPHQNYMDQDRQLWEDLGEEMTKWEEKHPPPGEAYFMGIERDGYRRYFHRDAYRWIQSRNATHAPTWCWPSWWVA